MEAYKQFKNENPGVKIGKSKFASLHPKHVVPVSDKDHNVRCCSYHENFEMLLDGTRTLKPQLPTPDELIKPVVCGWNLTCHFGECDVCSDVKQALTVSQTMVFTLVKMTVQQQSANISSGTETV